MYVSYKIISQTKRYLHSWDAKNEGPEEASNLKLLLCVEGNICAVTISTNSLAVSKEVEPISILKIDLKRLISHTGIQGRISPFAVLSFWLIISSQVKDEVMTANQLGKNSKWVLIITNRCSWFATSQILILLLYIEIYYLIQFIMWQLLLCILGVTESKTQRDYFCDVHSNIIESEGGKWVFSSRTFLNI